MSSVPAFSVLICTRNRPEKVKRAVESVLANSFTDYELVVVDQSTDPRSAAALSEIVDPRLRRIPTSTVGIAVSRNIAIRSSRAEIVVFTDDDCICDPEWLARIDAEYRADPTVEGVYGRVVPFGPARPGMVCPATIETLERRVLLGPAIPHLALGGGNNMSFRKDVFRKVGIFLESLGRGTPINEAEDTEFSYRVLWNRCKIVYSPAAVVEHDNWIDLAQFAGMMKTSMRGLGLVFVAYALRFDRLAFVQLLKTGYYLLRNRMAIGSVPVGLYYFAQGLTLGPIYRVIRPPRLAA
jgi:O-antigen biosynthesis protein